MKSGMAVWWHCVLLLACCGASLGESLKKPEIASLYITSDIKFRFATTTVTSRMKNPDEHSREAVFDVTLPNEAFITNMTLEINGKVSVGEIKEKEKAKAEYETAKQQGQTAGYIGTRHRETNRFNLNVNVAAQAKVEFHLTYQELLKRKHGHYEQVIYIDPGEPVEDMSVAVNILENRRITKLNVPRLRNDIETEEGTNVSEVTTISYATENQASVLFRPSVEFQQKQSESGMSGQFVVQYDVERHNDAGEMLMVNGYFVHFFAPSGLERLPNDIMFILDESGSMAGTKLQQLKDAMLSILKQLVEGDRFNIITFDGDMAHWQPQMVEVSGEDALEDAEKFIQSIQASGSTNIEGALRDGLKTLASEAKSDDVRSSIIVFLTDGEATSGVTNNDDILESIQTHNEDNVPIFSLAFGKNAGFEIVKKIALENNGFGRKIYEASDAAMQISGFYNEIAITLLNNVTFKYLDSPVTNLTKHSFNNYFDGSEIVVCGLLDPAYADNGGVLRMEISGLTNNGETTISPTDDTILQQLPGDSGTFSGEFETITEKVWAYLTIKQLLNERIVAPSDQQENLEQRALQLSLKYGFVTPLTSMVVITDDENTKTITQEDELVKPRDEPSYTYRKASAAMAYSGGQGHGRFYAMALGFHMPSLGGSPSRQRAQGYHDTYMGMRRYGSYMGMRRYGSYMGMRRYGSYMGMRRYGSYMGMLPYDLSYDDTADDAIMLPTTSQVLATMPTTAKPPHYHHPSKISNRRRNKNKIKGSKYPTHPIIVRLDRATNRTLCFDLKKDATPGRYLAYKDQGLELVIEVAETAKNKKGKSSLTVTEVEINGHGHNFEVKRDVLNKGIDLDTFDGGIVGNIRLNITTVGSGLRVIVLKENATRGVNKEGFIGYLLNKKVRLGKIKQRRKTLRSSIKFDKSKYSFYQSSFGQSMEDCWAPMKREQTILDLDPFRLV